MTEQVPNRTPGAGGMSASPYTSWSAAVAQLARTDLGHRIARTVRR